MCMYAKREPTPWSAASQRHSVTASPLGRARMKRARLSGGLEAQRVVIDVGGTKITTTVPTIKRSTYLAGMVDLSGVGRRSAAHGRDLLGP